MRDVKGALEAVKSRGELSSRGTAFRASNDAQIHPKHAILANGLSMYHSTEQRRVTARIYWRRGDGRGAWDNVVVPTKKNASKIR